MKEIFAGIIAGIISGLGMGGGTVLILILSIFFSLNQHMAQANNLIFFIPTSIVSIIINAKNKKVKWKIGILTIISGIIGAIIGAKISVKMNVQNLRKLFGYFLLIIAFFQIYELIKKYKLKINNK